MNRKIVSLMLVAAVALAVLAGCSGKQEAPAAAAKPALADGIYFAAQDSFDAQTGWKETVTLEVKEGKIVSAVWNGANIAAGEDKITQSTSGAYGMVAYGSAQAEWHVQAEKAAAYLLKTQDPTAIAYKDQEGHTDDIAGVSIHVSGFFNLAQQALAAGPVGYGPYKDGHFHAEEADFSPQTGWKETVDLTVISGRIEAVRWNGVHKDGGDDKITQSSSGKYGMVAYGNAQAEWHEQALLAEQHLLKIQDPLKVNYKDEEGHSDDVTGASIHLKGFFSLADQALVRR